MTIVESLLTAMVVTVSAFLVLETVTVLMS